MSERNVDIGDREGEEIGASRKHDFDVAYEEGKVGIEKKTSIDQIPPPYQSAFNITPLSLRKCTYLGRLETRQAHLPLTSGQCGSQERQCYGFWITDVCSV